MPSNLEPLVQDELAGVVRFRRRVIFPQSDHYPFTTELTRWHWPVTGQPDGIVVGAVLERAFTPGTGQEAGVDVNPLGNAAGPKKPRQMMDSYHLIVKFYEERLTDVPATLVNVADRDHLMTLIGQYPLPAETFITFR